MDLFPSFQFYIIPGMPIPQFVLFRKFSNSVNSDQRQLPITLQRIISLNDLPDQPVANHI